jgi:hypothetical protein
MRVTGQNTVYAMGQITPGERIPKNGRVCKNQMITRWGDASQRCVDIRASRRGVIESRDHDRPPCVVEGDGFIHHELATSFRVHAAEFIHVDAGPVLPVSKCRVLSRAENQQRHELAQFGYAIFLVDHVSCEDNRICFQAIYGLGNSPSMTGDTLQVEITDVYYSKGGIGVPRCRCGDLMPGNNYPLRLDEERVGSDRRQR